MGNGAASHNLSLEYLQSIGIGLPSDGLAPLPKYSGLCVSVPGAAACWEDLVKTHGGGSLSLLQVLEPAIELAENGFPIHECAADQWSKGTFQGEEAISVFKPNNGSTPREGEIFRNPKLGETFRTLGTVGAANGFYSGRIGEAIVAAAREFNGVLDLEDLAAHRTEYVEPSSVTYKGYCVYETPPPTHGIAALQALQMMEALQLNSAHSYKRGDPELVHQEIECMRLAFADALSYVADPTLGDTNTTAVQTSIKALLNPAYAQARASLIGGNAITVKSGDLSGFSHSDTVYFCCVDKHGNACSMINSNYMGFGTGISPVGCGFTLHNRGYNASLDPSHPNRLYPRKRPYHTIIPGEKRVLSMSSLRRYILLTGLITHAESGDFYATFGNMGGFMQPMGHFQIVRNLVDYFMQPQEAVDAPRWYLTGMRMCAIRQVEQHVHRGLLVQALERVRATRS
jgi:gamma-glutamyltranspeptidase/glutathione hydrolase